MTAGGSAPDRLRVLEQRPRRADVRIPEVSVREARRRGELARSHFTERVLGAREGPDRGVDRTPGRLPVPAVAPDHVPASERDRERTPGDRRGRLPRPDLGERPGDGDRRGLYGPSTPINPRGTVPSSPRVGGDRAPRDRSDRVDRSIRNDRDN